MTKTIWIRPAGQGHWLVATKEEQINSIDHVFEDFKNVKEKFKNALKNTNLKYRKFDEDSFDYNKFDSFIAKDFENEDYYKEEIEFMLVKMTDKQMDNMGEFVGW